MRRFLVAFAATIASVATIAPAAQADWVNTPTPGCVSEGEWDATELRPLLSRDELERKWHMYGQRVNQTKTTYNIGGHQAYEYKVCGFSRHEVVVTMLTERDNRPGYVPKPDGERIVVSIAWWDIRSKSGGVFRSI